MNNFREVNEEDILKQWYDCMEKTYLCSMTEKDQKNDLDIDKFRERILKNVPKQKRRYIKKQLNFIYEEALRYVTYTNEKYYRNGFVDGAQLIMGCSEK